MAIDQCDDDSFVASIESKVNLGFDHLKSQTRSFPDLPSLWKWMAANYEHGVSMKELDA